MVGDLAKTGNSVVVVFLNEAAIGHNTLRRQAQSVKNRWVRFEKILNRNIFGLECMVSIAVEVEDLGDEL